MAPARFTASLGWLCVALLALSLPAQARAAVRASSDFSTGDDGWLLNGDTTSSTPTLITTGGNPGAFLRGTDTVDGDFWYWLAPAKFRGNASSSYGQTLTFDLRMRGTGPVVNQSDVLLSGGGVTLALDLAPAPTDPAWTTYTALLHESAGWRVNNLSGAPATQAQVMTALSNITSLRIRGEFINGTDSGDLDNVIMNAVPEPAAAVALLAAGLLLPRNRRRGA